MLSHLGGRFLDSIRRPVKVKFNLVHNSLTLKIKWRGGHIALHKHEIAGASHHRMIRRLDVVCASHNGNWPHMPLHPYSDLRNWNALKPIETRCDGSSFSYSNKFRGPVGRNSQGILEDKQGTERGCILANTRSCHSVHYDIPSLIDGFMLKEGEVEGLETMVVRIWSRGSLT